MEEEEEKGEGWPLEGEEVEDKEDGHGDFGKEEEVMMVVMGGGGGGYWPLGEGVGRRKMKLKLHIYNYLILNLKKRLIKRKINISLYGTQWQSTSISLVTSMKMTCGINNFDGKDNDISNVL